MKLVVFLTCLLATANCLARTQPPRQRKEDFFARDRHRLANNRIHPLESSISSPAKDFVFYEPCTPLKKPFIIFGVVFPAIFAYFQFISLLFIPCLTTTVTSMTTITTTTTAINVGRRRMKLNQIEWEGFSNHQEDADYDFELFEDETEPSNPSTENVWMNEEHH